MKRSSLPPHIGRYFAAKDDQQRSAKATSSELQESRWCKPRLSRDGTWSCRLRAPLTYAQEKAGLLYFVIAATHEELARLMQHEDERAARFKLPAYRHRDTC
ncbi:hypothetical protein [Actinomadura rayongensis]|uniref:hypothetical protein n=1 Tax=Actinomadura rayongensis TaxID=1429076 RepID=UPI001925D1FD|nr:hypothetical protein [Actinomadura rayongensis]